jgi:hypothetical protein
LILDLDAIGLSQSVEKDPRELFRPKKTKCKNPNDKQIPNPNDQSKACLEH